MLILRDGSLPLSVFLLLLLLSSRLVFPFLLGPLPPPPLSNQDGIVASQQQQQRQQQRQPRTQSAAGAQTSGWTGTRVSLRQKALRLTIFYRICTTLRHFLLFPPPLLNKLSELGKGKVSSFCGRSKQHSPIPVLEGKEVSPFAEQEYWRNSPPTLRPPLGKTVQCNLQPPISGGKQKSSETRKRASAKVQSTMQ